MNKKLKKEIEKKFCCRLNQNQYQDLERLIFEVERRQNISTARLIDYLKINSGYDKRTGKNRFLALKNCLVKYRYPLTSAHEDINKKKLFLNKIQPVLKNNWVVRKTFKPATLFFEKETRGSYLVKNFQRQFPNLKIKQISTFKNYFKNNQFKIAKLKKPLVFITKETRDFLKPCPCTKNHLGCGYWIFNLGYGCPFDCSYCYLQQYTNSPGIVLPANLDDFFTQFDRFEKKLTGPVRIGTGEFLDSLALDHITNYSSRLISYFRNKKVLFELKTKSDKIENILREKPASNIIISWSLNPEKIVNSEEKGTPRLQERLAAAKKVQNAGFKVAFHFDPIIYYKNWEKDYQELTRLLYKKLSPPFAWISLGTLRANRQLKPIVEQRFPKSDIFYGELFIGEDKKIRYPQFLRETIYTKMFRWIRHFDSKTPLYLCMENKNIWKAVSTLKTTKNIENYLIKNNL